MKVKELFSEEVEDVFHKFRSSYSTFSMKFTEKLQIQHSLNSRVVQNLKTLAERLNRLGSYDEKQFEDILQELRKKNAAMIEKN